MTWRAALPILLVAALAAAAPACSGDDDDPQGAGNATTSASGSTSTETVGGGTVTEGTGTSSSTDAGGGGGGGSATSEPEGEPASREEVTAPAVRTARAESARVSTEVVLAGASIPEQRFGGEGVFDFEQNAGRVELDLSGLLGSPFASARIVFYDYVVYYGLPEGFIPGGKRWLVIDLQSVADSAALDFGSLFQGSQADPGQYLLWLGAIDRDVRRLGEETVRGAQTTRYRATVDLDALARQAPEGKERVWSAYVNATKVRLGVTKVPVEIWVDGDGLVRRMRQTSSVGSGGAQVETTITTELWDFGVEADVSRPPRNQTAMISDLIRP